MDIKPSNVLTFGILAVAFCGMGILGIIFGAIGKNKARAYVDAYGQTTGQVKAGSIMSKIGFIIGIIMTVIWAIYIVIFAVAAANGAF